MFIPDVSFCDFVDKRFLKKVYETHLMLKKIIFTFF